MSFLNSGLATLSQDFTLRITAAVFKAAQDILNSGIDPTTARYQLAQRAAHAPGDVVPRFIWLCASNPTIAGTVERAADGTVTVGAPDSDIEYVIASTWDTVAEG